MKSNCVIATEDDIAEVFRNDLPVKECGVTEKGVRVNMWDPFNHRFGNWQEFSHEQVAHRFLCDHAEVVKTPRDWHLATALLLWRE